MTYDVAGRHYKTKSSLLAELRRILYAYEPEETISGNDSEILAGVLDMHPYRDQKVGHGVSRFYVRVNAQYGNNRGFWLDRVDGSATDWSFMEALKPATNLQNVLGAMRWLIKDQITAHKRAYFADHARRPCSYTGEEISPGDSHVDHVRPNTFERLAQDFALHHEIKLDTIQVQESGDGDVCQVFADPGLAASWQRYHRDNAVLTVISRQANLSHAKRK
jgi:hypothetical protein